ncbi:flagellar hook-length control protein FliK [Roseomonas aeriglobus]|nr:flagellar hook-length control protein FliK [Roseomonas aeriglobus]
MTTTSDFALALADLAGGAAVGTPPADAVPGVIEIVPPRPGLAATGNSLPPDIAALVGDLPEGLIDAAMPTDPIITPTTVAPLPIPTVVRGVTADATIPTIIAAEMPARPTEATAPIPTLRIVATAPVTPGNPSSSAPRLTPASIVAPPTMTAPIAIAITDAEPAPVLDAPTEPAAEDVTTAAPTSTLHSAPAKGRARRTAIDPVAVATVPAARDPMPPVVDGDPAPSDSQSETSDPSPRKRQPAEPAIPAEPAPVVAATVVPTPVVASRPAMRQAETTETVFVTSEPLSAPMPAAPTAATSTTPIVPASETAAPAAAPRILSAPWADSAATAAASVVARPDAASPTAQPPAAPARSEPASSPIAPASVAPRTRPIAAPSASAALAPAETPAVNFAVPTPIDPVTDSDAPTVPPAAQPILQPQPQAPAVAVAPTPAIATPAATSRASTTDSPPALAAPPLAGIRPTVRSPLSVASAPSAAVTSQRESGVDAPAALPLAPTAAPERSVQAPVSAPAAPLADAVPAAAVAPEVRAALAAAAPVSPTVRPAADIPAAPRDVITESVRPVAPANVTTVPLPAAAPTPLPSDVMPAAQAFAQAMFAAPQVAKDVEDADSDALPVSLMSGAGPATATATPSVAVPATAAAHANTLDMSRGEWLMSMIDRIETLRDESGAIGETRLTLSPDALGTVDIAVRRDESGQYQVRISADTAQARTMLADAAPRLNDMAEARGLKLSHAGVETGTGTGTNPGFADSNRRDAQQAAPTPRRPASAATDSGATSDPANQDTRIA